MNKLRTAPLLLLAFVVGASVNWRSVAQTPSNVAGDIAMKRLTQLTADLRTKNDPKTLAQVVKLFDATSVLSNTREATITVAMLERLRAGKTNEVIELLEINLDSALMTLSTLPNEIHDAQIKTLDAAQKYRAKYPRKTNYPETDRSVAKAFDLLDKK